jgi:hypothetical protein
MPPIPVPITDEPAQQKPLTAPASQASPAPSSSTSNVSSAHTEAAEQTGTGAGVPMMAYGMMCKLVKKGLLQPSE